MVAAQQLAVVFLVAGQRAPLAPRLPQPRRLYSVRTHVKAAWKCMSCCGGPAHRISPLSVLWFRANRNKVAVGKCNLVVFTSSERTGHSIEDIIYREWLENHKHIQFRLSVQALVTREWVHSHENSDLKLLVEENTSVLFTSIIMVMMMMIFIVLY